MVTSKLKTTVQPATSATPVKKAAAKKVITESPAGKTAAKKTVPTDTNKMTPVPAKKVSVPKIAKPAAKPITTTEKVAKKSIKKSNVTPEARYHMIATAAYFRAEQRGFAGGYEMEDWISSEAQVDAQLKSGII